MILFYENFGFTFRTGKNVNLMNVQYMKLGVVYSTNIVFWKPIYQMIFSSTHWALCICDNNWNYSAYIYIYIYYININIYKYINIYKLYKFIEMHVGCKKHLFEIIKEYIKNTKCKNM